MCLELSQPLSLSLVEEQRRVDGRVAVGEHERQAAVPVDGERLGGGL
jgi:hypothetical protein